MSSPNLHSPSSQPVPPCVESPVLLKSVHLNHTYESGILDNARLTVLRDLGSNIPEVPFQTFMHFLAPPRPDFDIEATMEMLKSMPGGILTASGRWLAFDQERKDQPGWEHMLFEPMSTIFQKVICAIIATSKLSAADCSTDFLNNPPTSPMLRDGYNTTGGYLFLKDRSDGGAVSWDNVVLSCEYKQNDGTRQLDDVSTYSSCFSVLTSPFRTSRSVCGVCNMSCGTTPVAEPRSV
jgi:hypothetical protein